MSQDKEIRALYLKGIIPGKKAKIELVKPIGGREEDGTYVHRAEKGAIVEATMQRDGWHVVFDDVELNVIPLADGKLR